MVKLREANSMEECIYFTNRAIGEQFTGNVRCWVFREKCPKCSKAFMGKPVVDGKIKIRATEYVCPSCNYAEEKQAYEEKLTANIDYTCPKCKFQGQLQTPFKRKRVLGVLTLRFECEKCKEVLDVTKKMKQIKKKGKKAEVADNTDLDDE
jgi:transcription initiation factor IIE alpha subunit